MKSKKLKIKVCGMREAKNVQAVEALAIDMMGFIFYKESPRFIESTSNTIQKFKDFKELQLQRVGVFVNAEIPSLLEKVGDYYLDFVQLHGNESPIYCQNLKSVWPSIKIIKAFAVNEDFDFEETKAYEPFCDLFLFDTKGKDFGGNGVKYDWNILKKYHGMRPFLLSGGIRKEDVTRIKNLDLKMMWGVDLNSGFEDAPAMKNIDELNKFIKEW